MGVAGGLGSLLGIVLSDQPLTYTAEVRAVLEVCEENGVDGSTPCVLRTFDPKLVVNI